MVINSTPTNSTEDFLFHVHVVTTTFPGFGIFRQTATRLIVSKHIYGAVIQAGITTRQRRPPPPAFATTSTETIDFSIGFGFAALIYVSL
jgi:hypothetical protein